MFYHKSSGFSIWLNQFRYIQFRFFWDILLILTIKSKFLFLVHTVWIAIFSLSLPLPISLLPYKNSTFNYDRKSLHLILQYEKQETEGSEEAKKIGDFSL